MDYNMKIVNKVGDNMSFSEISDFRTKIDSAPDDFAVDSTSDDRKNTLVITYPWILDFRKKCLSELLNRNMKSLMKLIKFYNSNISKAVDDCYHKPKRAIKLKTEISNSLTFFHFAHKEVKTPLEHFSYLEKISDLMAMYVDMEIKASRNGIESERKVASMITSSLKLYFGKYPEYMLDSLLKTNLMTKRCRVLAGFIFRSVLRDDPETPLDNIKYIRYILAYKMWKEIMLGLKLEQQRITQLACRRLKAPIGFKEKLESIQSLRDLFPILPTSNITNFLMKAKFSSREKTKIFYKAVANPIVLATLNQICYPVEHSDSMFCEKGNNKVDQLLYNIWNMLSSSRGVSDTVIKNIDFSDELPNYSVLKRKREEINNDIKLKPKKKPTENLSLVGEDKNVVKLEIEDVFSGLAHESLYRYEHSIEDFFQSEEDNKNMLSWKSILDVKKEKECNVLKEKEEYDLKEKESYDMKENKSEDLNSSECCMKSDIEDEIIDSSNECLFDLKEDLSFIGGKGDDGEHASSLPLKKRRGFPYNKYVKSDNADTSDMIRDGYEERKMIFKTPAQLKAFSDSLNESTDLINLALGSNSVYSKHNEDISYPVSQEADSISDNFPSLLVKRKAPSRPRRGRRKRRGRPKKKNLLEQDEESNRLLDELTTTDGFFK